MALLVFPPFSLPEASEEVLSLMYQISDGRHKGLRFIREMYNLFFYFSLKKKKAANLT